jgi:serine-type D-Ala-D-Ala carboxypeptidase (penicillin-binding protein 5/6)
MTKKIAAIVGVVLAFGATAAVAIALWPDRAGESGSTATHASRIPSATSTRTTGVDPGARATAGASRLDIGPAPPAIDTRFVLQPVTGRLPVRYRFKHPPLAGILFDVKSGEVLWQRHPRLEHPVASLTKMMTALMVADRNRPSERVRVSRKAAQTPGSATGLLPRGKKVPLEPLLQALIMISANDAAVALAQHDAGTTRRFVKEMNFRARSMALRCTHYSTPNGLRDRNNYSCPVDLAELARADLANRRIAQIAETRYAKPRFPIKGKHLYLSNNHYFLQRGLAGLPQAQVTGLKTGFTDPAGRCYVTTARIGRHQLGVVLLHSPDPLTQVPALLRAGCQEVGAVAPGPPPSAQGPKKPPEQ